MSIWGRTVGSVITDRDELHGIADDLAPHALKVLLWIARRLKKGQVEYGKLDLLTDTRDWRKEIREELLDTLVYEAMESVQKEVKGQA